MFSRRSKEIPADPSLLAEARDWAEETARDAGLSEADCYQIKLAMSEAVANAIQHGSRTPADKIELSIAEEDDELVFEVRDTGTFIPRPRPENGEGGRGLELLALMMDHVEIASLEGGSLMRFSKRLS